ncbi:MAG: MlaD family protein [bacterium]|nr:MlaD family protein [bacterium]
MQIHKLIWPLLLTFWLLAACRPPAKEVTVLFADGKGIAAADKVYQSGIAIGKVGGIGLADGKAAVRIRIDADKWPGLKPPLACFIDTDPADRTRPAVLVRSLGELSGVEAQTLQGDAAIEGVDSFFVWKVLEFAKSVSDLERSEFMQQIQKQIQSKPAQ